MTFLLGVNLAGAEFGGTEAGKVPGIFNKDYTYPTHEEIDYYSSHGLNVIRLPFLWERLQLTEFGQLNSAELSRLDDIVNYATSKGLKIEIEAHDYGMRFVDSVQKLIGNPEVPNSSFADLWSKLASHFKSNENVIFGLMNEPHVQTASEWLVSINAAVAAIRSTGAMQQILVPGTNWDGAWTWKSSGNEDVIGSGVKDPANNFAFEVHQYLDEDGTGTHKSVVSATIGVERITEITQWAEATGNHLFLGEVGVYADPGGGAHQISLEALGNMLTYIQSHTNVWEGVTYWAGGPWWPSDYIFLIEPQPLNPNVVTPQLTVLLQHLKPTTVDETKEFAMTTYTAPPTQTHLVLNGGDALNVEVDGLAYGTLINQGAVLRVASGGMDIGTTNNGGNEYVDGTSTGMTINFGGLVFVEAGAIIGTTINAGGTEYDQGGASIGTTINLGGSQYVQNGSTATNTTINGAPGVPGVQIVDGGTSIATTIKAGLQIVRNGGMANNTIILDGGIEHVQNGSTANNVIFAGSNSLLDLDKPSGLTGTIIDWNVGDKIDFLNTKVTGVNESDNTLTVTYGDHQTASYSLVGKQANTEFQLQPDGNGGSDLILQLPLKVGDATSAHLLSLAGGGIKAMTADAGLFAGLLQHFSSEGVSTTIGHLLSKISAVSANSGSSWFTDLLAYSPSFEDSLQDYTHFFSKNGYMGELEIAYNNYAKTPSGTINEFIVGILKDAGEVAGMDLVQLYALLDKSSVNWNDFLTNVIFEPDQSAKLLQSVNFHSDQSHRTDALPSQSLIFQSSISSNDAAINKYDSEFGITTNETVSKITNAGTDSSGNTYIFIPAVITSLGSETDISAPGLPSISTGSLNVTYSTYAGSPSATTILPNFNFDGLSAFLATSASSAAGSAVSSGGVYTALDFGGYTRLVSAALNEVQNISPLVQVNNASGISTASNPTPGILDGYTTPDFLVTQGHSLLRLADGAYIDNTSVTSGLTYLQANNHLSKFTVTALTYFDGVDPNLGKINPGYNKIGQQAETLFTGSDQHQAVPIPHTNLSIDLSHPSAAVFDSAQTTGLDAPIWEYIGSNGFKLDYFQLDVTTAANNNMDIAAGERGTLDLWVVTTTAPALPGLNTEGWKQYLDLYDQMIAGLQSTNNGHIGADLLASSLGFGSDGLQIDAPSTTTIQNDYLAITRTFLSLNEATTVADAINAGTQTEAQYVSGLLSQVSNTAIPAVAVEALMYGMVGTSAEVTSLATQFLPDQVAFATQHGLNAQVYASEALGLALAFGNETGSATFATNFGPSNAAMESSTAGDLAFATAAATAIFGSASTTNLVNVMDAWVTNWKAFYTGNGLPGIANATAAQIDLAARGAAWGDTVGVALDNNLGPLKALATNFLQDAAQGTAVYSAALASQPNHAPFQGESGAAASSAALSDSPVQVVGVAPQLDHAMI